jgi:hypothetical protein
MFFFGATDHLIMSADKKELKKSISNKPGVENSKFHIYTQRCKQHISKSRNMMFFYHLTGFTTKHRNI